MSTRVHFDTQREDHSCLLCLAASCFCWQDTSLVVHPTSSFYQMVIEPLQQTNKKEKESSDPSVVVLDVCEQQNQLLLEEACRVSNMGDWKKESLAERLVKWINWMGTSLVLRSEEGLFVCVEDFSFPVRVSQRLFHPVINLRTPKRGTRSFQEWVDSRLCSTEACEEAQTLGPTERGSLAALLGKGIVLPHVEISPGDDEWHDQIQVRGLHRGRRTECEKRTQNEQIPNQLWTVFPADEERETALLFPGEELSLPGIVSPFRRRALLLKNEKGVLVWDPSSETYHHVTTSHVDQCWTVGKCPGGRLSKEWESFFLPQLMAVMWDLPAVNSPP